MLSFLKNASCLNVDVHGTPSVKEVLNTYAETADDQFRHYVAKFAIATALSPKILVAV